MKLSKGVRYALRMMVDIAKGSRDDTRVPLSRVAAETHMPRRYLEQLAIPLRRAELLKGTTGRGGGYVLGRAPEDIPIRQIIESVVGPIGVTSCAIDPESCSVADGCECRVLYELINGRVTELLEGLSLADLIGEPWKLSARLGPADPSAPGTTPPLHH